jgi:hypothetical protein
VLLLTQGVDGNEGAGLYHSPLAPPGVEALFLP